MPHFEKVTLIKADHPIATAIGGHYGVNYARKNGSYQTGQVPLPESQPKTKIGHPGRIYLDNRLQKPEVRPADPQ
jgi:hypothetical protein